MFTDVFRFEDIVDLIILSDEMRFVIRLFFYIKSANFKLNYTYDTLLLKTIKSSVLVNYLVEFLETSLMHATFISISLYLLT